MRRAKRIDALTGFAAPQCDLVLAAERAGLIHVLVLRPRGVSDQ